MTAPTIVLRMDLTGTAFGTAPTYTDYTTHLTTAGDGEPISITWGAQDEQGEPSPRSCSFVLENPTGQWTPRNAAADADWGRGVPVNVRVTHDAVTYDRFTGFVDSVEPEYPGASWSRVRVTCSDVTSRLGSRQPLRSLLAQEMLADSPTYLYALSEPAGSTSAGDLTGNTSPATRIDSYGTGALTFGEGPGMFDVTSGIRAAPELQAAGLPTAALSVPVMAPASAFSFVAWVRCPSVAAPAQPGDIIHLSGSDGTYIFLRSSATSGRFVFSMYDDSGQWPIHFSTTDINMMDGGLHMLAGVLESDRKTSRFYVDGADVSSSAVASVFSFTKLRNHLIGAAPDDYIKKARTPFPGVICMAAMYPTALSAARVLAHYEAGTAAGPVERTDERFERLAGYASLTVSGLPTGQGEMGGQVTNGVSVTEALAKVARTEGTRMWVKGDGALTFEARNARYWPTAGLTLTGADIDPESFTTRLDGQGFANEATATNDGGAEQRHVDTASQTAVGRADAGSLEVAASTDYEALQLAAWKVATSKVDKMRVPSLRVDLLTTASTALVTDCLEATIGTYVALTGLPSQAPSTSMNLFIEGGQERIGVDAWDVTFFTSPEAMLNNTTTLQTLRADSSPSARTELDAGLVIPL